MLNLRKKPQFDFGLISASDDIDIAVVSRRRESQKGVWSESLRLMRDVFLIIVVFVLIGVFAIQPVLVEGTSMLPQLHDGERLLVNKLVYYKIKSVSWGHIQRGDIVVFWYPSDPDKSYVKRVIGLPGETVEVRNGRVYIDGKLLDEPYLDDLHNKSLRDNLVRTVDQHYYFVLGDNRDNSSDSRYWGLVPEKYIYGKAFFRYWRPSDAGFLEHGSYNLPDKPSEENSPHDDAD